jgi:predicted dehydrogenase
MKPLRVAIVGLGYWGPNWLRNFSALDECEVAYACDLSDARLKKFSRMYPGTTFTKSYDEVLADSTVQAVVIATPTSTHFQLAKDALNAGMHVLVEKPMTSTSKEAAELTALAKKNKLQLLVDHTFAYTQAVAKIAEYADAGKLGNLLYFDSTRINLGLIQKDTNVLYDLAVHDLTILNRLQSLKDITEVFACGSAFYGKHAEVGHLHLKFKSGFHAHIHVSWLSPVKLRQTLIGGKKAMIVYDDLEPSEKIKFYDKGVDMLRDDTKPDPFFPKYRSGDVTIPALKLTEALETEARHFLACIRGGEKPLVSGEDGERMVRILELADKSMAEHKPLKVSF